MRDENARPTDGSVDRIFDGYKKQLSILADELENIRGMTQDKVMFADERGITPLQRRCDEHLGNTLARLREARAHLALARSAAKAFVEAVKPPC